MACFNHLTLCIWNKLAWDFCGNLGKSFLFVQTYPGRFVSLEREFSEDECPFLNQGQYEECVHETLCSVLSRYSRVVMKDRNAEVLMPQWSPLACLNLHCLFDWRVRSFDQPNCSSVLCSEVLYSNVKNTSHFFKYLWHKSRAFIWNDRRW